MGGFDWQGHEWEEDKWHVDLSGHTAGAVDAEGWAYAVDFAWLPTPPPPGAGRKCAQRITLTLKSLLYKLNGSKFAFFKSRL